MGLFKTQEEKADRKFDESAQGQARLAYERGDQLFQTSLPLSRQTAIIAPMMGGTTKSKSSDWSAILNAICAEGWRLQNFSTSFVETGSQSRDKFTASGQNVAVSGHVAGFYIFVRDETQRH